MPEARRAARAVRVLELIGTPKAAAALQRLARGASEASLTAQAKAALRRIRNKSP